MGDRHRAYRGWLIKRLGWLSAGAFISCVIGTRIVLATTSLTTWADFPSLAIVGGSLILLGTMFLRCIQVVRMARTGDRRRARNLRKVLAPYRELTLAGIAAVLSLEAIPLLFENRAPTLPEVAFEPIRRSEPVAVPSSPDVAPANSTMPVLPPAPPQPAPARSDPALPRLASETDVPRIPPPLPALPAPDRTPAGREDWDFPHRPEAFDFSRTLAEPGRAAFLDRGGLPTEDDANSWPAPELAIDITILPESGRWRGFFYDSSLAIPFTQHDGLRISYFAASLNDEEEEHYELEPTLAWHRLGLEYERRIFGYTRHATFDLSLRIGAAVDYISTHEAAVELLSKPRISPWIGFETALWEGSGFGLVSQGAYSIPTRLTGVSASVLDLRVLIRYDLSERVSFHVGIRLTAVRLHDQGLTGGSRREEVDQAFVGPLAGFALRF